VDIDLHAEKILSHPKHEETMKTASISTKRALPAHFGANGRSWFLHLFRLQSVLFSEDRAEKGGVVLID
jgi:hypothetical protein